jgi:mercuric ion transport protein
MKTPRIELVYFDGCPNALTARDNIKAAVEASGQSLEWSEWDLMAESTPEDFRRYGSPTVLVDGRDVTGDGPANVAMACRAEGAPSVAAIAEKLL